MAKIREGGGQSDADCDRLREMRREIIDKHVRSYLYPTVVMSIFLPIVVKQGEVGLKPPPGPITAPVIGVLLLFSFILVCCGHMLAYLTTVAMYLGSIFLSNHRLKQTDRILDLDRDHRRHLINFFWGGGKEWFPRRFALHQEVKDWCKQSGVRYTTLTRRAPQSELEQLGTHDREDRAVVWFARPEDAVAFKMRWY